MGDSPPRADHGIDRRSRRDAAPELCAGDWLDDERFARRLVDDRRASSGWGSRRLRHALAVAGIAREFADPALAPLGPEAEFESACALLRRRFPAPTVDPATRRRALSLLVRRLRPRARLRGRPRARARRAQRALLVRAMLTFFKTLSRDRRHPLWRDPQYALASSWPA